MIPVVTQSTPVPVTDIGKALARLWEECQDSEQGTSLSRTLTMNLIGVAHRSSEERMMAARTRLLTRHPCRAFLVFLDEACADISAEVSAETHVLRSCQQLVLEQVTLRATPGDLHKLPGLVRPLLVNDIPVHHFWGMELPADVAELWLLGELARQTTVDSSLFTDPPGDLKRLRAAGKGRVVVDLTWFRLRPWRRGLAEAFEHFRWRREVGTQVAIRYGCDAARASSHLLAYWLEERVGAEVEISSTGSRSDSLEPELVEITHGDVHVMVTRLGVEPKLTVQVTLTNQCILPFDVVASRGHPGDLLAAAVDVR